MIEKIETIKELYVDVRGAAESIEMLVEKTNEIIDVINGKGKTITINAVDAKSFDEHIKRNPGSIAKIVKDAIGGKWPPDEAA